MGNIKGLNALLMVVIIIILIGIVFVVILSLYPLGFKSPCKWTGTMVSGFSGFTIPISTANMSESPNTLRFLMVNNLPDRISISNITMSATGNYMGAGTARQNILNPGENSTFTIIRIAGTDFKPGDCYAVNVGFTYYAAGTPKTVTGTISGIVS